MANMIKTEAGADKKQILFATQPSMAVGVVMSDAGAATVGTKKIQKAGTPISGDLETRTTAFTVATTTATGVLLHDVDVTDGAANATCLIFGFVDLNKVESDVNTKLSSGIKTSLAGKVTFLK